MFQIIFCAVCLSSLETLHRALHFLHLLGAAVRSWAIESGSLEAARAMIQAEQTKY